MVEVEEARPEECECVCLYLVGVEGFLLFCATLRTNEWGEEANTYGH